MYILNNWSIKDRQARDGTVHVHLFGKVFSHPRFAPGEVISTSTVTHYRFDTDSVVTHSGSEYRLGKPDAAEPLAKQRLIFLLAPKGTDLGGGGQSDRGRPVALDAEQTRLRV
jgi:hypothetical protein